MTFAALQTRVNSAVIARLTDAATVGGIAVNGIFNDAYADPLGIAGSAPSLVAASSDVAAAAFGTAVIVGAVSYTVAIIQPDGTGLTRLILQEV